MLRMLRLPCPQNIMESDAHAQSNARNMVSQVESCYTDTQDYSRCRNPQNTRLPTGSGPGQVEVASATKDSYVVVAHSASGTDFSISKSSAGRITRTCNRPKVAACM